MHLPDIDDGLFSTSPCLNLRVFEAVIGLNVTLAGFSSTSPALTVQPQSTETGAKAEVISSADIAQWIDKEVCCTANLSHYLRKLTRILEKSRDGQCRT